MRHEATIGRGMADVEQTPIGHIVADVRQPLSGECGSQVNGLLKLIIVIAFAWIVANVVSKMDAVRKTTQLMRRRV
jgi:hypothetical protein